MNQEKTRLKTAGLLLFLHFIPIQTLVFGLDKFHHHSPKITEIVVKNDSMYSVFLSRTVRFDVLLPVRYEKSGHRYPVLYLNDGQDLEKLRMNEVLHKLYLNREIEDFILVAIHCNKDRIQEYGTAAQADYAKRGAKAHLYTQFILKELMPYINRHYPVRTTMEDTFFAGFSLGGLSALDIVWHHPDRFSKAGVFSGSFWWRSKPMDKNYKDSTDRIMHQLIKKGNFQPNLQFWFEAGTEDEKSDRNKNGIIDAIDDTLDLIIELEAKGYQQGMQIVYYEIKGGKHNQDTWSKAMPVFLKWLLGKK